MGPLSGRNTTDFGTPFEKTRPPPAGDVCPTPPRSDVTTPRASSPPLALHGVCSTREQAEGEKDKVERLLFTVKKRLPEKGRVSSRSRPMDTSNSRELTSHRLRRLGHYRSHPILFTGPFLSLRMCYAGARTGIVPN